MARNVGINRNSARRLVKRRKANQFKRLKIPQIDNGTRDRRIAGSGNLDDCFGCNLRLVKKFAFQDE